MEMVWPSAGLPPKICSRRAEPSTTTLALPARSSSVMKRPSAGWKLYMGS